jgi:hypothetical protein
MRTFLACFAILTLSGCGLEILSTAAIGSGMEAKSASTAARALDYAKETTGNANAQHAIDLYKADKGSNPPSLEALVPAYLDKVPVHPDGSPYGYDPGTGRLFDKPLPAGIGPTAAPASAPGAGDWQGLNEVNGAIQHYAKDTGMYPVTLYSLIPKYLKTLPKTSSGQDFAYDSRTGLASIPGGPMPGMGAPAHAMAMPPRAPRGGGVGGGGPMGETMTGIAISNQLDSMNNSGTSSAGGHAGSSLQRSQDEHNAQQEQALRDAGM